MSKDQIQIGQVQACWNVSGTRILKYVAEMYHSGLNEHRLISAPEVDMLENKINLQSQKWIEKWEIIESRQRNTKEKAANLEEANSRTEEAIIALKQIDNLLIHALSIKDNFDWESLKKKEKYSEPLPTKPIKKEKKKYPPKPEKRSAEFTPMFTFFDKLVKSKKERKIQESEKKYSTAISDWEKLKAITDDSNNQLEKGFENELEKWESDVGEWTKRENNFLKEQADFNLTIDQMRESYLQQNNASIIEYCEMILNNSKYPDFFPQNFELEYNPDNKILIVEYELPAIECFPKIMEVKYIATRKELKESYISESQLNEGCA